MSYADITRSWLMKLVYKIKKPMLHKLAYRLTLKIHKKFLCQKEHIIYSTVDGSQSNFCEACGEQVNPFAFNNYDVVLFDGTTKQVNAVSEQHARSQVIYENTDAFDGITGKPLTEIVLHPENIKSVTLTLSK